MSAVDPKMDTLRLIAEMPFLDRLELSAVSGRRQQRVYEETAVLRRTGLVGTVPHATTLMSPTRRLYVTRGGLRQLAEGRGYWHRGAATQVPRISPLPVTSAGEAGRRRHHLQGGVVRGLGYGASETEVVQERASGCSPHTLRRQDPGNITPGSHLGQDGILPQGLEAP